jgi:polysaccharide export outer membrane protein
VRQNVLSASLAAFLLLSACAPGSDLPSLPAASTTGYTLGSGDRLRIITYGEDQLTGDFTVNDSGTIEVPLLGSVVAKGRTVTELQTALIQDLKQRGLLRNPSVSVEISAYRPIFVLGEVSKPGQYPYQPNMTVITAAAVAGGFTYRAVKNRVAITRTDDGKAMTGQADPETRLQPGDVVNVFERSF